jgi:phage regulator Rha-like protein
MAINHNGQLVVDSRDVARMVYKEHKMLMRGIRTYIKYMGTILKSSNSFIQAII